MTSPPWVESEEQRDLLDGLLLHVAALSRAPDDYFACGALVNAQRCVSELIDSMSTLVAIVDEHGNTIEPGDPDWPEAPA